VPDTHVEPAWTAVQELPIAYHPLRDAPPVIRLARRLERHSAYDAAYLTLAQELHATCWTLDGRLVCATPPGLDCPFAWRRPDQAGP
jgi:predicted nucleic acid-binding protein